MQYFLNISNTSLNQLKIDIKNDFLHRAGGVIQAIQTSTTAKSKEKATQVNNALNGVLILVKDSFTNMNGLDDEDKAIMALIVQYIFDVHSP